MSLSMYQASVPVFVHMLGNLSAILEKAAAYTESKKIDQSVLIQYRLAPDMLPLAFQIRTACDMAARGAARLAGLDVPSFPDTETTFAEFQARIAKAIAFIQSVKAEQIDGAEERDIVLKSPRGEMKFKGQGFLLNFSLPNLYFHVTTAYNILRHNGLDLGKMDYVGKIF